MTEDIDNIEVVASEQGANSKPKPTSFTVNVENILKEGMPQEIVIREDCLENGLYDLVLRQRTKDKHELTESIGAIDVIAPYGDMIAKGEKTLLVRSADLEISNKPMFLAQDDRILGQLVLKRPFKFDVLGESSESAVNFSTLRSKHKLEDTDLQERWEGYTQLWGYPIDTFEPFDKPRKFKRMVGPRVVIPGPIEFIESVENGTKVQITKQQSNVKIIKDGEDCADSFPAVLEEVRSLKARDVTLEAEVADDCLLVHDIVGYMP